METFTIPFHMWLNAARRLDGNPLSDCLMNMGTHIKAPVCSDETINTHVAFTRHLVVCLK